MSQPNELARHIQAAFTDLADRIQRDLSPLIDALAATQCDACGGTYRPSQNHTHTRWERLKARLARRSQT